VSATVLYGMAEVGSHLVMWSYKERRNVLIGEFVVVE